MEESPAERLILIVQDNPEHTGLIKDALNDKAARHQIVAIADGVQAMDFLNRRGNYADATRPDLILLDLNLPGKDGRELLAEIKANPQLRRIPIVVLTISANQEDIFRSYALQGNCYVIKSSDLEQLFQIVKRIEEFWLGIVTLPVD
ncbi:MAG TPA: response regulator [Coleofasciculaceae cyanobacterium]|jgi:chemotaxis family two-component system response regulator Rcp1